MNQFTIEFESTDGVNRIIKYEDFKMLTLKPLTNAGGGPAGTEYRIYAGDFQNYYVLYKSAYVSVREQLQAIKEDLATLMRAKYGV